MQIYILVTKTFKILFLIILLKLSTLKKAAILDLFNLKFNKVNVQAITIGDIGNQCLPHQFNVRLKGENNKETKININIICIIFFLFESIIAKTKIKNQNGNKEEAKNINELQVL